MLAQMLSPLARWWRGGGRGAPALPPPVEASTTLAEPASGVERKQKTPPLPDFGRLGISGTQVQGGRIWDREANRDLRGRLWPPVAEKMRRTDPVVMVAERATINTQLTATFRWVVPSDAQPRAVEARDFLTANFGFGGARGRLTGGWEGALGRMLLFQSDGYRYQEETYRWAPGRVGPVGRNYVWVDYADCEPSAHDRWLVDSCGGLAGVKQLSPGGEVVGDGDLEVPANKLLLLTHGRTGSNFEGVGLLRPCWFPWTLKSHTYDQIAVGVERWAVPTPMVKHDLEALQKQHFSADQIATMIENAKETAKNYVCHEQAYLSSPVGISFETFGDDIGQHYIPGEIVKGCNQEILTAFGLQFLLLGVSDTGSRAVGDVQASFFRRQAVNGLDYIAAQIGGTDAPGSGTCGRLMRWNFPDLDESEWPRLQHEGLDPGPLLDLLPVLASLASAGIVTPRDALEDLILNAIRAPLLTDDDKRPHDERVASNSPMGAAFALAERKRKL